MAPLCRTVQPFGVPPATGFFLLARHRVVWDESFCISNAQHYSVSALLAAGLCHYLGSLAIFSSGGCCQRTMGRCYGYRIVCAASWTCRSGGVDQRSQRFAFNPVLVACALVCHACQTGARVFSYLCRSSFACFAGGDALESNSCCGGSGH